MTQQVIPQGPVAALEFIKNLGTNGGGFFNANGAHPYENPTPLTNLIEMLAIAVLPAALTHTFGRMVGRRRDGWLLFGVMVVLFIAGLALCGWAEQAGNPRLGQVSNVDQRSTDAQAGGNMEGKETRFGIGGSVLTAITTSNGATGSYNSMHDSYMPLGGMIPLVNMLLGEVIFGGLGTGLYSIILVALIGLFVGGLMVGRTPEYLGKPIGPTEMKLISLYALLGPATILLLTALAVVTDWGTAGLSTNSGPHGLSEIVFAYTSSHNQQWPEFRWPECQLTLLQCHYRLRHDHWSFWLGHSGAGAGRAPGAPGPPTGVVRDPADGYAALCVPDDRDDPDRWRAELLARPRPGASGRASAAGNVRAPWGHVPRKVKIFEPTLLRL